MSSTPQSSATKIVIPVNVTSWSSSFSASDVADFADAIESGKLLYAPDLAFELTDGERRFLSPECLDNQAKNISLRSNSDTLRGTSCQGSDHDDLRAMLRRYFESASHFISSLLPSYVDQIQPGFTTFRPAQISGRATSRRHDDTRLHVDAFPSRPMQGQRIFRVFTNVNPNSPRLWRVGEPFEHVAERFLPKIRRPFPGSLWLLHRLRIVKGLRTEYDHFMLGIHDRMKADEAYQSSCPQTHLALGPNTTWACYTDSVSHAAMSGQFAFEQTFSLPISAMKTPEFSPLRILERLTGRTLL